MCISHPHGVLSGLSIAMSFNRVVLLCSLSLSLSLSLSIFLSVSLVQCAAAAGRRKRSLSGSPREPGVVLSLLPQGESSLRSSLSPYLPPGFLKTLSICPFLDGVPSQLPAVLYCCCFHPSDARRRRDTPRAAWRSRRSRRRRRERILTAARSHRRASRTTQLRSRSTCEPSSTRATPFRSNEN